MESPPLLTARLPSALPSGPWLCRELWRRQRLARARFSRSSCSSSGSRAGHSQTRSGSSPAAQLRSPWKGHRPWGLSPLPLPLPLLHREPRAQPGRLGQRLRPAELRPLRAEVAAGGAPPPLPGSLGLGLARSCPATGSGPPSSAPHGALGPRPTPSWPSAAPPARPTCPRPPSPLPSGS